MLKLSGNTIFLNGRDNIFIALKWLIIRATRIKFMKH
jgi:hypothetical protein